MSFRALQTPDSSQTKTYISMKTCMIHVTGDINWADRDTLLGGSLNMFLLHATAFTHKLVFLVN